MKTKITLNTLIFIIIYSLSVQAQSSGDEIESAVNVRKKLTENSWFKNYKARSIGPVVQGGRIVDLDVDPENPQIYYVAYASGGLFKTTNNGISFEPVFDDQGTLNLGDIALAPSDPNIIYVGTGEKNSSRSSYAGIGVYKSKDAGKTWEYLGLNNTQHISRIIVHPANPDIVWVASIGALYSDNDDRGIYKSTDGGKTWNKTLFINNKTGIIDIAIHPSNPDYLLAASWERKRQAWNFKGNGKGSTIHRSEDGGKTWTKSAGGFPDSEFNGRIGLNFAKNDPTRVYAVMDSQAEIVTKQVAKREGLKTEDFINMTSDQLLSLDDKKLNGYLRSNNFPRKYNSGLIKKEVKEGKYKPKALAEFLGNANDAIRNAKIIGAEIYRSDDSGKTWNKINSYPLDGVYLTFGYYFGEINVDPNNKDIIYVYGVPLLKSLDGGKTFTRIDTLGNVHVDHQAFWINPKNSDHLLLGNDGGLYSSYDGGAKWLHINNDAVGQFYSVNVDMEKPYNVYGGLQDNGTYVGSSRTVLGRSPHWTALSGGDGMLVAIDSRNSDIVYTGLQFGNYARIDRSSGARRSITPTRDIGEPKLRFNWRTPMILSKHNDDVLYMGAQKLFRSMNQGKTWDAISGDLTKNKPQGNVPFSTISAVAESGMKFGLIYVGTDDGNLHVTKNGGGTWSSISNGLPSDKWVSSVFPSNHDEGTVFTTLTGYRDDDFQLYIFVSKDYGSTWKSLKGNLPNEAANVIVQDPVNESLLYLGTDHGTYVSLNGGEQWQRLNQIPNVASYDMVVHPRDNELVVGTHGRSVYVVDVKPLQQIAGTNMSKGILVFNADPIRFSERWGVSRYGYVKPRYPKVQFTYFAGKPAGKVNISIFDEKNNLLRKLSGPGTPGFHEVEWDVKVNQLTQTKKKKGPSSKELQYAKRGTYTIEFSNENGKEKVTFEIK